jgi:amino acid permease
MQPKIRSPLATWFLTIITSGIYLPFWAWNIANELNTAEKRTVFKVDFWRKAFLFLMLLVLVSFVIAVNSNNPIYVLVTTLCLLILFINVQLSIGNYIKLKDVELNTGKVYSNSLSIFLLWLVANTGVAYMQSGINRIITHERENS